MKAQAFNRTVATSLSYLGLRGKTNAFQVTSRVLFHLPPLGFPRPQNYKGSGLQQGRGHLTEHALSELMLAELALETS